MTCQFLLCYGAGRLSGILHLVDSRILCLPQNEEMRTDFRRTKGSLV